MAEIKVYYEQKTELMTIFWQPPRKNQIYSELDDGIILIKDAATNEPIGIELLSYCRGSTYSPVQGHVYSPPRKCA